MRVLAIRGENLASLAGPFQLDFTAPPLAGAGLFAITGPTGAGKSTLFDALCLALFHDAPRLGGARARIPDGEEFLLSSDGRTVLRRGVSSGFAEVDFVGVEGGRWRARWSVRRARGRGNGRLQAVEARLEDLDGHQPAVTGITAVRERVVQVLGLTSAQFRRAVLLAQNDFAALLRAPEEERAALLETLTGTEIYARLSRAAHERAARERAAISDARIRLGEARVLDDAARAALDEEAARAAAHAAERAAAVVHARNIMERCRRVAELDARVAAAHAEAGALAASWAADHDTRAHLARWSAVLPLQGAWNLRARARAEVETHAARVPALEARLDDALQHVHAERARMDAAASALQGARADVSVAEPALAAARRLDLEVRGAEVRVDAAASTLAGATAQWESARQRVAHVQSTLAARQATQDAWERWKAAVPALAVPDDRWQALGESLAALVAARGDVAALETAWSTLEKRRTESMIAVDRARAHAEQAALAWDAARQRAQEAEDAAVPVDPRALGVRMEEARNALAALMRAQDDARRVEDRRAVHVSTHSILAAAEAAVAPQRDAASRAREALAAARLDMERARDAAARATLAAHEVVARLREQLLPGEPCEVCGSTEHPHALKPLDAGILHALAAAASEASRKVDEASRADVQASRSLADAETALVLARERAALAMREWMDARDAFHRSSASALRQPRPEDTPAVVDLLRAEATAQDVQLRALEAEREHALRIQESARAARAAADAARQARDDAADAVRQAQDAVAPGVEAASRAWARLQEARERDRTAEEALQALLPRDAGAPADVDSLLATWRRGDPHFAAAAAARTERGALDATLAEARARVDALALQLEEARSHHAKARADMEDLRRLRAQALPHADVEAHAAHLAGVVASAVERLEEHKAALARAQSAYADAVHALEDARRAMENAAARALELDADLASALASLPAPADGPPLSPAQVDQLVPSLPADLHARVAEMERQARDRRDAEVRATQLEEERARLRGQLPEGAELPHVEEELVAVEAAHAQAVRQHAACVQQRAADDDTRQRAAGQARALAQQEAAARRWLTLDAAIGSSDGRKFRVYAQSFALQALLDMANQHLDRLYPRYALRPGPEAMSILVEDRHAAGLPRSPASLSGGETFLVSLALALGLASLSSERVRVESLFIDEGLGSLDGDTLHVAMDALDRLQAEGRKVGIVSHVQGIAERVGVQVRVVPTGGGASRVEVVG